MTVKELIDRLQRFEPDTLVVMSRGWKDSVHGNIEHCQLGFYSPRSEIWGEFGPDEAYEMDGENPDEGSVRAVNLTPTFE